MNRDGSEGTSRPNSGPIASSGDDSTSGLGTAPTVVRVIGGFLGAGKTTAIRRLASYLAERGESVAIVTNDQGRTLVDTELLQDAGALVQEIGGGCLCCKYSELENALLMGADAGATVALVEAVGSCTDLIATVLAPMADRHPDRFAFAPLSVLVDPWRVREMRDVALTPDVEYLFRKQIEEADVVVLTRLDLEPPDVRKEVHAINGHAATVAFSSVSGEGLPAWLAARPVRPAAPLAIDYDRYAAAEASLCWLNGVAIVENAVPFSPAVVVRRLFDELRGLPVFHLKVAVLEPSCGATAALVRRGGETVENLDTLPAAAHVLRLLLNARIAMATNEVEEAVRGALAVAAAPSLPSWQRFACFEPARPTPVYRYASRTGPSDLNRYGHAAADPQARYRDREPLPAQLASETDARLKAQAMERRSTFLADASRTLSSSLDYQSTLTRVAELAVPEVADFCAVYVGDDGVRSRPVAVAHYDKESLKLARELAAEFAHCVTQPDNPGVCSVRQTLFAGVMRSEQVGPADPCGSYRELAQRLSLATSIAVPLVARDHALGVVLFGYRASRRNLRADLALAQDLAGRAALAVDNSRLYMEAQRAIRVRDEFLSIASHELRTPVTSILLGVQLLQHMAASGKSPAEAPAANKATLATLDRQSRHLDHLIDRLLDVGRIQGGHWTLDLEPNVDLADVASEVASAFHEKASLSGSILTLHAAETGITGTFDRTRIAQVVSNLLDNALRYGGGHPVDVTVGRAGNRGRIAVRDRGTGIAPETQQEIFEAYKRASSTSHYAGLGLGLYIVRQIVQAHGGTIHVDSALGTGSTFVVEMPCDPPTHAASVGS